MNNSKSFLNEITYVKIIRVGTINPNALLTDQEKNGQIELLNRCLKDGKGVIIGKDVSLGSYQLGGNQLTMESTSYHIGFKRKPHWLD